jgi:hypothetical protein
VQEHHREHHPQRGRAAPRRRLAAAAAQQHAPDHRVEQDAQLRAPELPAHEAAPGDRRREEQVLLGRREGEGARGPRAALAVAPGGPGEPPRGGERGEPERRERGRGGHGGEPEPQVDAPSRRTGRMRNQ